MSVTTISVERTIQASPEAVFAAVAEVEHLADIVPDVTDVEFLTETRSGVGTRFVETRQQAGRDFVTELEITEHEAPKRVRMVAENRGTVWDSLFEIEARGDRSLLRATMEARADKMTTRLRNKAMAPLLRKAMAAHLDAVKAHLEG